MPSSQAGSPPGRTSHRYLLAQLQMKPGGTEERSLPREGLRHINLAEGQTTPPTPSLGLAGPSRGPAFLTGRPGSQLCLPIERSVTWPTDRTGLGLRLELGLRALCDSKAADPRQCRLPDHSAGPPRGLGCTRGGRGTGGGAVLRADRYQGMVLWPQVSSRAFPGAAGPRSVAASQEKAGGGHSPNLASPALAAHSLFSSPSSGKLTTLNWPEGVPWPPWQPLLFHPFSSEGNAGHNPNSSPPLCLPAGHLPSSKGCSRSHKSLGTWHRWWHKATLGLKPKVGGRVGS